MNSSQASGPDNDEVGAISQLDQPSSRTSVLGDEIGLEVVISGQHPYAIEHGISCVPAFFERGGGGGIADQRLPHVDRSEPDRSLAAVGHRPFHCVSSGLGSVDADDPLLDERDG